MSETSTLIGYQGRTLSREKSLWFPPHRQRKRIARCRITR